MIDPAYLERAINEAYAAVGARLVREGRRIVGVSIAEPASFFQEGYRLVFDITPLLAGHAPELAMALPEDQRREWAAKGHPR